MNTLASKLNFEIGQKFHKLSYSVDQRLFWSDRDRYVRKHKGGLLKLRDNIGRKFSRQL